VRERARARACGRCASGGAAGSGAARRRRPSTARKGWL
jgi:hypothetical protein